MLRQLSLTIFFLYCGLFSFAQTERPVFAQGELSNKVKVENATLLNSKELDFSPAFYQTGMVYVTSRRKNGPIDFKIKETFFELFYAEVDRNGIPLKPEPFSRNLNSQFHEGPVSFSRTGDKMYFSRNNLQGGVGKADSKGGVEMQIYEAKKGPFDWVDIEKLEFNSDEFGCMHPSLSPDGNKLYFTSNMPGGQGGWDLYVVERKGERWSKPTNLGATINSPKNESFPFIHESGTLFFASNGWSGSGGIDIFNVDLSGDTKGKVENLGSPFNSQSDDLGLILNKEGTRGYFTSNREGGYGEDDIYLFEAPDGIQGVKPAAQLDSRIFVYDAISGEPIPQAAVRIFKRSEDGFIEGDDLYDLQLLPSESDADELVMKLVRKKEADLGKPKYVTDVNGEVLTKMQAEGNYLILVSKDDFTTAELRHSTINEKKPQIIEVPLTKNSCITLNGTVINATYSSSIPNSLVTVLNLCDNTQQFVRTNIQGEFELCLPRGCDYGISAKQEGYAEGKSNVSTVKIRGIRSLNTTINLQPYTNEIVREPIKKGSIIVLENIYYDFNKSSIRAGAARELDALVQLMQQYPSMTIELISHTDSRGRAEYNQELSLRRAESAKSYLVSRGIAGSRIKTFGYGESQPRNQCRDGVTCSEEEHQYNRRTDVRIVSMSEDLDVRYQDDGPEVIDRMKPKKRQ